MRVLLLLLLPLWLPAQTANIDADFRFVDGVYLSHAALLANRPDVGWEAIAGEMVQLPTEFRVQIDGFGFKDERRAGPPYAICLDGLPYLFVRHDARRDFHEFAALRVRGPYSTLHYDTTFVTRQLMKAYNPATGQPFRQAWVERERTRSLLRIVDFRTGRRLPLDHPTVLRLVATEPDLVRALERTPPDDTTKLNRALRIYAERQPLALPIRPLNR